MLRRILGHDEAGMTAEDREFVIMLMEVGCFAIEAEALHCSYIIGYHRRPFRLANYIGMHHIYSFVFLVLINILVFFLTVLLKNDLPLSGAKMVKLAKLLPRS